MAGTHLPLCSYRRKHGFSKLHGKSFPPMLPKHWLSPTHAVQRHTFDGSYFDIYVLGHTHRQQAPAQTHKRTSELLKQALLHEVHRGSQKG